jgi:pimeloyl-ACP methyl ester carboxylesterase
MLRLSRFLALSVAGVAALIAIGWWMAKPATPDPFYAPPAKQPPQPGALLRQAAFDRGVPSDAQGWRILYATTRHDGSPAVASAIVVVSRNSGEGPRPLIVWTHGTTGFAPGCAPSLLDEPFANVPALRQAIDKGWVIVGTDYVGLGTSGPHPYLVGEGEARSALDSIRAVRQMKEFRLGDGAVVWGHSQGGHAALWTGVLAPTYAPELNILGVAAVAPASDLRPLLEAVQGTTVGRIMSSFVLRSYSEAYPDVKFNAYASGPTRWIARDMSGRCLAGREALFSVAEALATGGSIFGTPPTAGPLGERLAQNTPARPVPQPLLIAQGLADDLVLPEIQVRFVRGRCGAGQALEYRTYAGRDHVSVVAPDSPLTRELVEWTQERIDKTPARTTCDRIDVRQPAVGSDPARR